MTDARGSLHDLHEEHTVDPVGEEMVIQKYRGVEILHWYLLQITSLVKLVLDSFKATRELIRMHRPYNCVNLP